MNRRYLTIAVFAALWTVPQMAAAGQTMYRCGNKYQDSPCESGEGSRIGKTSGSAQAQAQPQGRSQAQFQTEADAAECSSRGKDSLKISWAREAGATAEKQIAEVDKKSLSSRQAAQEKRLIGAVYEKRGSSMSIRADIEGECMAEKEKIRQAQTLAAAAAKLMQDMPSDAAPGRPESVTSEQHTTARSQTENGSSRAQEEHKLTCSRLTSQLTSVRNEQHGGASASRMSKLNDSKRELEKALRSEGC
jgi:hypothetical protein